MSLRTDPGTDGQSDRHRSSMCKQRPGGKTAAVQSVPTFIQLKFVTNWQTNPAQQTGTGSGL